MTEQEQAKCSWENGLPILALSIINMLKRIMPSLIIIWLLVSSTVVAQEEEPAPLTLTYLGEYLRVTVFDQKQHALFNRKLVGGQSFSLPDVNSEGKARKQFTFKVGERNLVLKLKCSAKQRKKQLASDIFTIAYAPHLAKKPPCFVSDDGPAVNLPVSA